jgi:hypothetical protein
VTFLLIAETGFTLVLQVSPTPRLAKGPGRGVGRRTFEIETVRTLLAENTSLTYVFLKRKSPISKPREI